MRATEAKTDRPTARPAEPARAAPAAAAAPAREPAWSAATLGDRPPAGLFAPPEDTARAHSGDLGAERPGDPSEQAADRAAEQAMRMAPPAAPPWPPASAPISLGVGLAQSLRVQRKCACGGEAGPSGECDACRARRLAAQASASAPPALPLPLSRVGPLIQRAPADSSPATGSAPAPDTAMAPTPAPTLIVGDDAAMLEPGQLRKSAFLDQLEAAVCRTAEQALAGTFWSSAGCPWVAHWFGYYRERDSAQIERAIRRYAPETAGATSAQEFIPAICARVRQSIATWTTTGEVTGVPEGVSLDMPGGGIMAGIAGIGAGIAQGVSSIASSIANVGSSIASGIGGALSSIGGMFFKERPGGARAPADPHAIQGQLGGGHLLDSGVQGRMERAFGASFGQVRVHTDATAATLSDDLNARAFTVGRNVAFGAGEYRPGTLVGDALIAHELAHVVQQGGATAATPLRKGDAAYGALEEEADRSAVGAVAALWGGLGNITQNALPNLRSGLRLQSCSPKAAPTPAPAPAPTPAPAPSGPIASDLQIAGLSRSTAAESIFFDRNSSTIDSSQSPKIGPLKSPTGRDLTLFSFISEDENVPPAAGAALAHARFTAVDTALRASPGEHTGPQRPVEDTTSGIGQNDYRSMRKVVVVPTGAPSGVLSCAGGGVVPCTPASQFTSAQTRANTLLGPAISALTPPLSPATEALLDARFGTSPATRVGVAALVKTNLSNLRPHITTQMTPAGSEGPPRVPGHRCANECDALCGPSYAAYNSGRDATALMTLCVNTGSGFMRQPDTDVRAATLIHEGLHGITLALTPVGVPAPPPTGTKDFSYGGQRLINFLDPATALKNTDSYVLFVRQVNGHSVTAGRATPDPATGVPMSSGPGGEREELDRALAWLEGWLIWARQDIGGLYGTIKDSIPAGSWTNTYYQAVMGLVAPHFSLTVPPALPAESDKFAVAALHERFLRMRGVLYSPTPVSIDRVSAGTTHWAAGPAPRLTVGPDFFGVPAGPGKNRAQLNLLLEKMVEATSGISPGARPHYVALVDEIRIHKGGGAP